MTGWLLQLPNLLGFVGIRVAGRGLRLGWTLGLLSEFAWAGWGYASHNYGIFPWCVLWGLVYAGNWHLWRKGVPHGVKTGSLDAPVDTRPPVLG